MRVALFLSATLLIIAIGCSTGSSPLIPDTTQNLDVTGQTASTGSNQVLWGLWDVTIDPDTMTAELVPIRGPAFTANVTQFMQPPSSPIHMISFNVLGTSVPEDGYFELDVALRHPVPGVSKYNGFDVKGILISDGSLPGEYDASVLRPGPTDTRILNADGFTRWWNPTEFTSFETIFGFTTGKLAPPLYPIGTVNPYKYFADNVDDLSGVSGTPNLEDRGAFSTVEGILVRGYDIQFRMDGGEPDFSFNYAVGACWEEPDPLYAPEFPPEAYPLTANQQEAFTLDFTDNGSTAWYVDETNNGGELNLHLEIYDWQALENPDGVEGEVAGLWLEGPILSGPVDVLAGATIFDGSSSVSSVYEITIGSLNLTQPGVEELFITIENTDPNTYEPQIPGGDAFAYPDNFLAAYFTFNVIIGTESPGVQPTVIAIDPDSGYVDDSEVSCTVTGLEFDPLCTAELSNGIDTLLMSNFQYVDAGNLTFNLDLTGAVLDLYDVIVTNPIADPGVLEDGFEVKEFLQDIWPTTQGNSANTGYVENLSGPYNTHSAPTWTYNYTDSIYGNSLPVFLSDDTAYFTIAYNYLDTNHLPAVAVDLATQTLKWSTKFNLTTHSSLNVHGISGDGSIVLVYDWPSNLIYGLDADDGTEEWSMTGTFPTDTYAVLDDDGNFIIPLDNQGYTSVDPDTGTVNWTVYLGDPFYCTPAVGDDGTIYVYVNNYSRVMHALDPSDGSDNWSSYPSTGDCRGGLTYHSDGFVMWHTNSGLQAIQDNGTSWSYKWTQSSYPMPWYTSASIGPDDYIYTFDGTGTLRKLDPDTGGTLDSSSGWEDYGTRPAIGEDGLIYTNNGYNFRCFNTDLTLRWQYFNFPSYWSAPALGQDGTVYSAKRNLGLCAWVDD